VRRLGSLARIFGVRDIPGRTTLLYDYGECDLQTCRGMNRDGTCPNRYGVTCLGYRDRLARDE
jgi:hypothetical protein